MWFYRKISILYEIRKLKNSASYNKIHKLAFARLKTTGLKIGQFEISCIALLLNFSRKSINYFHPYSYNNLYRKISTLKYKVKKLKNSARVFPIINGNDARAQKILLTTMGTVTQCTVCSTWPIIPNLWKTKLTKTLALQSLISEKTAVPYGWMTWDLRQNSWT